MSFIKKHRETVKNYITVTELPGQMASKEQLARLYQRYNFANSFCGDRDVLEIACGAGLGLGYLAKKARSVVGGDIDEDNLKFARSHYTGRSNIILKTLDAQNMPFENNSFDAVILYEAIYYLKNAGRFFDEAHRVLRHDGFLILCSVNKDWNDFNPSPFSQRYYSVPELRELLKEKFDKQDFYGGFPTSSKGPIEAMVSAIKKSAVRLHLVPKTMKGKEFFKRLFFGRLYPMPAEIGENMTEYIKPEPISPDMPDTFHKIIYVVAHKKR